MPHPNRNHNRIRSLRPGQVTTLRCIIVEKYASSSAGCGRFKVADETGSVNLLLLRSAADVQDHVQPGEIFRMTGVECQLNREGCVEAVVRNSTCLSRTGFLTLAYQEKPNLSATAYEAPAETTQGKNCFLCASVDHNVYDCPDRPCGVGLECSALNSTEKQERHSLVQTALRAAGLPEADSLRWYNKVGQGVLYLRFESAAAASMVISSRDFLIEGNPVKLYPISPPRKRRAAGGQEPWTEMDGYHPSCSSTSPGKGKRARLDEPIDNDDGMKVETDPYDLPVKCETYMDYQEEGGEEEEDGTEGGSEAGGKGGKGKGSQKRPREMGILCFLCSERGHSLWDCKEIKRGFAIRCPALDNCKTDKLRSRAVNKALNKLQAPLIQKSTWKKVDPEKPGLFYGLFESEADVQHVLALEGPLMVENEPAEIWGKGVKGKGKGKGKGKNKGKGKEKGKGERKGDDNTRSVPATSSKACFLCGDVGHELPTCPVRKRCLLLCRDWGTLAVGRPNVLHKDLLRYLMDSGVEVVRHYWHKNVCYTQLSCEEQVQKLLSTYGARGFEVCGETIRLRAAKSTRTAASTHARHEQAAPEEPMATPDGKCPVCGSTDHSLPGCPDRQRALIIRCASLQAGTEDGAGAASLREAVLESQGDLPEPSNITACSNRLFATFQTEADAASFLESATGMGLELGGCMASVEQAGAAVVDSSQRRLPGLRPEARREGASS